MLGIANAAGAPGVIAAELELEPAAPSATGSPVLPAACGAGSAATEAPPIPVGSLAAAAIRTVSAGSASGGASDVGHHVSAYGKPRFVLTGIRVARSKVPSRVASQNSFAVISGGVIRGGPPYGTGHRW